MFNRKEMIQPDKHTNLDFSIVNISAFIISKLRYKRATKYDELMNDVTVEIGDRASINYPYALNFLYLLGKLEYDEQTDTFILNEA